MIYTILGYILLALVIGAVIWLAFFESSPCQPKDYYKGWRK